MVPRYIQLAGMFRNRIASGEWPRETKIPTVEDLAEQCGVARMTIRQALGILVDEGLIARYRARGTFVREMPQRDLWCEVQTDWSGMLMAREGAQIELLSDTSGHALPHHGLDFGRPCDNYRLLRRKHSREGEPFLLADVYIEETVSHLIPEEAFTQLTALRLVSDLPGRPISSARQQLTIGTADLTVADALAMPLGDPVAKVLRLATNADNMIILLAHGIYRGDRVRLDFKLR